MKAYDINSTNGYLQEQSAMNIQQIKMTNVYVWFKLDVALPAIIVIRVCFDAQIATGSRLSGRPRPQQRVRISHQERAAKSAAPISQPSVRSRPRLLLASECSARAHSQWALLEAADIRAAASEAISANQVHFENHSSAGCFNVLAQCEPIL